MRVLLTTPLLDKPGGVANYYKTLHDHLKAVVEYFTVGSRTPGHGSGADLMRVLKDYWHFYRQVKLHEPDLVHLNPSLGDKALLRDGVFLIIAKLLRRRVVVFIRGWDFNCEQAIRKRYSFLFRLVYFRADAFIVLASRFKSMLADLGYDKPIYLETTVVSNEAFSHERTRSVDARAGHERLNILFLSRVERAKGVYEAVEAFGIVRAKYPCITMTVAGDGSELENLKAYVKSHGIENVKFVGWVSGEAKCDAFANADVYLFPSWGEGMPNSVIEAMAYGLSVITRPVGGIADFFEDGKMGSLTESRDPDVLARLLEQLIEDPARRQAIAHYNRRFAKQHFAASVVAARLTDIYRKSIDSHRITGITAKR